VFAWRPWLLFSITVVGWLAPVVLEQLGLLAPTWSIVGGAVVSKSDAIQVDGAATIATVFGGSFAIIAVAGFHAAAMARSSLQAQRQLVTQAWHLRQLLPTRKPPAA
jgi:hypothetical protein